MDTMKNISQIRKRLGCSLQGQFSNMLWCLLGALLAPIFLGLASLVLGKDGGRPTYLQFKMQRRFKITSN